MGRRDLSEDERQRIEDEDQARALREWLDQQDEVDDGNDCFSTAMMVAFLVILFGSGLVGWWN